MSFLSPWRSLVFGLGTIILDIILAEIFKVIPLFSWGWWIVLAIGIGCILWAIFGKRSPWEILGKPEMEETTFVSKKSPIWKRIPNTFNEWQWWRKNSPIWRINNIGHAKITHIGGTFYIELPVEIKYWNRSLYTMEIDCTSIYLDMDNKGAGLEGHSYRLSGHREGGLIIWKLKPGETRLEKYIYKCDLERKPRLEHSTICKFIAMGKVNMKLLREPKLLKSAKHRVTICWENNQ